MQDDDIFDRSVAFDPVGSGFQMYELAVFSFDFYFFSATDDLADEQFRVFLMRNILVSLDRKSVV